MTPTSADTTALWVVALLALVLAAAGLGLALWLLRRRATLTEATTRAAAMAEGAHKTVARLAAAAAGTMQGAAAMVEAAVREAPPVPAKPADPVPASIQGPSFGRIAARLQPDVPVEMLAPGAPPNSVAVPADAPDWSALHARVNALIALQEHLTRTQISTLPAPGAAAAADTPVPAPAPTPTATPGDAAALPTA